MGLTDTNAAQGPGWGQPWGRVPEQQAALRGSEQGPSHHGAAPQAQRVHGPFESRRRVAIVLTQGDPGRFSGLVTAGWDLESCEVQGDAGVQGALHGSPWCLRCAPASPTPVTSGGRFASFEATDHCVPAAMWGPSKREMAAPPAQRAPSPEWPECEAWGQRPLGEEGASAPPNLHLGHSLQFPLPPQAFPGAWP